MCRHVAYVGPPRSLAELLLDPPHSLLRQSYAPGDMRGGGTVNADGFGIGWYTDDDEAVRYRRTCPMWADEGLPALARSTRARAVIGAVRSATVGMPVVETAAAPFAAGGWMFSHNGVVPGWPHRVEDLAARLPVRDLMTLDAPTDSALLWALVRHRLLGGEDAVDAVAGVTREVGERDPAARLNLLLLDGVRIVATAWDHALSVLEGDDFVAVSSEPWDDDPRWRPVPDRHLVVAQTSGPQPHVLIRRLDENAPDAATPPERSTMNEPTIEVHLSSDHAGASLRKDVRDGLGSRPLSLPPKWFYDARGSELFEQITELDEYYPTRAESAALRDAADEIARMTKAHTVVELGAGSSEKTRLLLDALTAAGSLQSFVPQDVSPTALEAAAGAVAREYPDLTVHGVVGDFTSDLHRLPGESPRLVAFLGGTIGNFMPDERHDLLTSIGRVLDPGEWLLLGTDLVKDPDTLVRAYDDARGVTAEFNRNVLHVLNRELGADFDVDAFEHVALWDADHEWVEMRLRATREMRVRIEELAMEVQLSAGEEIRTEVSAKFREERAREELAAAGFDVQSWLTDAEGRFALSLAQRTA